MAHIRKHAGSPYWYLRVRNFDGTWSEQSLGLRIDDPEQTYDAKRAAEKASIKERLPFGGKTLGTLFDYWVPAYLASRYRNRPIATQRRVEIAWSTISAFLKANSLYSPRQIKYQHAQDFLQWRQSVKIRNRVAKHNTARMELKFLSLLMNEAVRRGAADSNPFYNLVLPLAPQKRKKSLSDDEIKAVREALVDRPAWMGTVFEIMLWTGCRFNESSIDRSQIDLANNNLTLVDSKRPPNDPRRYFSVPIHPELRPVLARIIQSGAERTVDLTAEKNHRFNALLRAKANGATSHCLRVTFVTRCHKAGLGERQAMRLVNHSSFAIHEIYSRLTPDDLREAQARISMPPISPPLEIPSTPGPI